MIIRLFAAVIVVIIIALAWFFSLVVLWLGAMAMYLLGLALGGKHDRF